MRDANDRPRAPRLPRVEPVLAETREQAQYERETQAFTAELTGRSISWKSFFRQFRSQAGIWLTALAVFAVLVLVLALTGTIPTG